MTHNNSFVYIDNVKIAHLVYDFIQERIDQQLASYSCADLIHNEQDSLSSITHIIENEMYSYISTLIHKNLPVSIIKNIGELPIFIEFLITKWNPVIKEELALRINYIISSSFKKQQVS
jgi:hypothetical protein